MPATRAVLSACLLLAVIVAATAAARPHPAGPATVPFLRRRLARVVQDPPPYTLGVFNGTVVPVPQGPLAGSEIDNLACKVPRPSDLRQVPDNLVNLILDTLVTRPACEVHQISSPRGHHSKAGLAPPKRALRARAVPDGKQQQQPTLDVAKVAELFAAQPWATADDQRGQLERISSVLGVTLGEAKALGFKKKALLELDEAELQSRVEQVAAGVGVTLEQAKRMAAIQPNLLLEPKRNSESLALGLRAISYELGCPKEEAVDLILNNRSILHGREMHLSVADIAHLAMLRQPTGRIVD
ncbi:hypothetical protein MNEG_8104 [Monoraphidium neglectum]|uniref:Uncharacterized protein n=1 Tax=Monoraphidium neglectum TaxID=145388 RepID=A0A0D2MGK3_9CHLO|nr:hypothetical protein MNEG_8104 [Monoraphidium neglectum]KIY99861.1 hypothetical protein MNEG_8104 [Monoraphidium neglectum]|eukprot:XP_013898881.1 hypothetical protein MNEG_8104 [Monoraphidium neglectum]